MASKVRGRAKPATLPRGGSQRVVAGKGPPLHLLARGATFRRTREICTDNARCMAVCQDQRRVDATATRRGSRPKFAMRLASGQSGRSA